MSLSRIFPAFLLITVTLLFISYIVHFSTGIPQADDFPMMLHFLDQWEMAVSTQQKYSLLTAQFLEHRMLAMKFTVLTVRALHGSLDINIINAIGVLIWLMTLYIVYRACAATGYSLLSFLPVLFFTLHPGFGFDGLFWAATWMAFPWAILLSLTSFYTLIFHETKTAFTISLLLSLFAMFSHGNGILSCVIGLPILLFQRKYTRAMVWFAVSAAAMFLFFYQYQSAGTSEASPLRNVMERPLYVLCSIGAFTGASLFFPDIEVTELSGKNLPAVIFGWLLCLSVLMMSVFVFLNSKSILTPLKFKISSSRLLIFLCAVGIFIIATAVMISCVRTGNNLLHGFAARYHFYSALLISIFYLFLLLLFPKWTQHSVFKAGVTVVGLIYCLTQYGYQTAGIADRVRTYEAGLYNSKKSGMWVLYQDARFWERGLNQYANEKLWPAGSTHYRFPDVALDPDSAVKEVSMAAIGKKNLIEIKDADDKLFCRVKGPLFQMYAFSNILDGVYVNLVSKDKSFLYPLYQERMGLRQFITGRNYYKPELKIDLKKKWFSPGLYRLSIFIVLKGSQCMIRTDKVITIKNYPYEV